MRIRRIAVATLLGLLCLGIAYVSQSGESYNVECTNESCGFMMEAIIGGGWSWRAVEGYCTGCGHWVVIDWGLEDPAPDPIAEFWDPVTGRQRKLYECSDCGQPFVDMQGIADMRYCPKCNEPSLEATCTYHED